MFLVAVLFIHFIHFFYYLLHQYLIIDTLPDNKQLLSFLL